jgi:hypothetical protein
MNTIKVKKEYFNVDLMMIKIEIQNDGIMIQF